MGRGADTTTSRRLPALLLPIALAACGQGDGLRGSDPLAPPGTAAGPAAQVDQLLVGDRLMDAGEAELALAAYTRAAGARGLTPEVKSALAQANIALGRLGQAERLLRDVVEDRPRDARALNNLGVVLLETGRVPEANRVFRAAFALEPLPEIRDNLRVSAAKLENRRYSPDAEQAFTLTRLANGTYRLSPPADG